MTAEEKERMLRMLPEDSAVTILDCEIRVGVNHSKGSKWLTSNEGHKITELIALKYRDGYNVMNVLLGNKVIQIPYSSLTCTAIQVLDTICPDDIYDVHEIDPDM